MTTLQYRTTLYAARSGYRILRTSAVPVPVVAAQSSAAPRYAPLVLHTFFFILVLALWLLGTPPATMLYVSGGVGMLVYPAMAVMELRRAPLFVSPLSALLAWYIPPAGPCAIHYANTIADGEPILYSVKLLHADDIAAGYVIMVLGNLALHAGLQWTRPLSAPGTTSNWEFRPRLDGLFALWIASRAFRMVPGLGGSLGAIAGVMHFGSTSALAAFLLSRDPRQRNWVFWCLAAGGTAIEFVSNLNSGSKAYLMFSFMPFLWLFLRDQKLRRFVPVLSVAMFVLYVSVIAPVVMASRTAPTDAHDSAMSRIMRPYSRGGYEEDAGADKQLPRYLERAFDATATACIHGEVQRLGYMYGEGMDYLAYAFVPRILWPEKPTVTRGAWFSEYLGQARTEESATTSLGQTAPGELYWNFGWLGVISGMAFLGAITGKLWKLATPFAERDCLRLLLYFEIMYQMTNMAEAGSAFIALVYRTLILGSAIIAVDRIWGSRQLSRAAI